MLYISNICMDGVGDMNKEYESAIKEIDKLVEPKKEDKDKKQEVPKHIAKKRSKKEKE